MPAVSCLPAEVLGEIFLLSLDGLHERRDMLACAIDYRSTLSDYPFVFTAVCRSWAAVAKSFPRLWSTINILVSFEVPIPYRRYGRPSTSRKIVRTSELGIPIYKRSGDDEDKEIAECFPPLAVIKDWIELSRGTPLSFSVQPWVKGARPDAESRTPLWNEDLSYYSARAQFILESVLARHHLRWQVASLHLLYLPQRGWLPGSLSQCHFPLLQDLRLDIRGNVPRTYSESEKAREKLMHDLPDLLSRSPNLRSFAFACNPSGIIVETGFTIDIFQAMICWEKLSEISITGWKGVKTSTVLQLLATCERLETLSVRVRPSRKDRNLPRVCAERLNELHLSAYGGNPERLIDSLTAPNLSIFSLPPPEWSRSVEADTFMAFMKRSNCKLQCLNMFDDGKPRASAHLEDNTVLSFVEAASATLETLRLSTAHIDSVMNYLTVKTCHSGPTPCPRLRKLKISFLCHPDRGQVSIHQSLQALTTMVQSRWDPAASSAVARLEEFDGKIVVEWRNGVGQAIDVTERDVKKLKALADDCASPRRIILRAVHSDFEEETVQANLVDSRQALRCWRRSYDPIRFEDPARYIPVIEHEIFNEPTSNRRSCVM